MCGLLFSLRLVASTLDTDDPAFDALLQAVTPRGPDSLKVHVSHVALPAGHTVEVKLAASVLGLRGQEVTAQPLENDDAVLGWNGQVFQGMDIGLDENDTTKLFERLRHERFEDVLASIEGPYACIYLDRTSRTVHYRIDPLSRRSLLIGDSNTVHDRFILCSARCSPQDVDISLRAMDGGEGGVIRLDHLTVKDGMLNLSSALTPSTGFRVDSPWTRVAPIDTSLPPPTAAHPSSEISSFISSLTASVRRRVENIPPQQDQARLAVLFSGGVDCSLIAALAHRCLPLDEPIDLVNVAFERSPAAAQANEAEYAVPDRISGLDAAEELRQCCPGRVWRFVEVNVPYEECMAHRQKVVDLMYPNETEMDLSLAFPLYFASRGVGFAQTTSNGPKTPYTVRPKVYLSGLGADEQLAGYSRHKHAFRTGSWPGLISELQLDITRLPTRNLSRDDRIISSHARDARFPYLDLTFIQYLSSLSVWLKCDPTIEGGDKLLLRLAAKQVGLERTSGRVKRAMQFGTRSAKVGGAGRGAKKGDIAIQSL